MGANAYESIQEIKTLIEHKLDLASINYNNNITLNQATYLLNQLKPDLITEEDVENYEGEDEITANEVTIPTYEAGVDNLPSNFQKYINFLKNVISNAGYNITPQGNENFGLTSLINRIKFTPDIELSYVNDEEDEDTVILTATVTLNSEPLFGLPISFYDVNDNLVGNGVTNSDGECSVSVDVSNVVKFYSLYSGDDDYSNVSSRNLNVNDYLFYDNATDDTMLSTYNNASKVNIEGSGSVNFTYDSTNQRYKATTSGNSAVTGITLLTSTSNTMTGRVRFRITDTSGNRQLGIYARYGSTNYFFKILVAGQTRRVETSVSGSDSTIYSQFNTDNWYTIEFIRNTKSLTGKIYNADTDTLIKTLTLTGSELTSGRSVDYGVLFGYSNGAVMYFDEVSFKTS